MEHPQPSSRGLNDLFLPAFLVVILSIGCSAQPVPGSLMWEFDDALIHSPPAVGEDGVAYVSASYSFVYAINPDGSLNWHIEVGDHTACAPSISEDGTIYVGSEGGRVYAIRSDGGQGYLEWESPAGGHVRSSPAIGVDGTVYVGSDNGFLYAIASDGKQLWRLTTGGSVRSSPALAEDGTIYLGSDDGFLYAVSSVGNVLWVFKAKGAVRSSPAIGENGTIYVGSEDGTIYAVYPDGGLAWEIRPSRFGALSPSIGPSGLIYVSSAVGTPDNNLEGTGGLVAIKPNGTVAWCCEIDDLMSSSPPAIDANGTIYAVSHSGNVYAISSGGELAWSYRIPDVAVPNPVPVISHDGLLYVSSDDLHVLETNSAGPARSGWPMLQANPAHMGRPERIPIFWTFSLADEPPAPGPPSPSTFAPPSKGPHPSESPKLALANVPPRAGFEVSREQPSVLDSVSFEDESIDENGRIVHWIWDFGDGTKELGPNPTHQFTQKGKHTVTLTVIDDEGLTSTSTRDIAVVNHSPIALFAVEPEKGSRIGNTILVGEKILFDASLSVDLDGEIVAYAWTFGTSDPITSEEPSSTQTFTHPGTYDVILEVKDNDGASASWSKAVVVETVPPSPTEIEDLWALVIGIGDYEDDLLQELSYPEKDAESFHQFLVSPMHGGFPEQNTYKLIGKDARLETIFSAIERLRTKVEWNDLVVFYFAGHGGQDEDWEPTDEEDGRDEYLLPYDASRYSLEASAIRDDRLEDWLSRLECGHTLLIFDSCHSGGTARGATLDNTEAVNEFAADGRLILAAAKQHQKAYEDDKLGHGVFTHFLLKGLGARGVADRPEADSDMDGDVTVEELTSYLQSSVDSYVKDELGIDEGQDPIVLGDPTLWTALPLTGYKQSVRADVLMVIAGSHVFISLGSAGGVQMGDRFEVVRLSNESVEELQAVVEVDYVMGRDTSSCRIIEELVPLVEGVRYLARPAR